MRIFIIAVAGALGILLLCCAGHVYAQNEHLDEHLTFSWNAIAGCLLNRGIWFHTCRTETNQYSEAQIGNIIKHGGLVEYCDQQVKRKWTECAGLYPKPLEAIELEPKG